MRLFPAFRILHVFVLIVSSLVTAAQNRAATLTWVSTLLTADSTVDGFYQSLPAGYDTDNRRYPLIVYLHGDESKKDYNIILTNGIPKLIADGAFPEQFRVRGQEYRFIVIAPHFDTSQMTPVQTGEMIDNIVRRYRVDASRIYLTGMSRGSEYTWEYAGASAANAARLAAIAPVSNALHSPLAQTGATIGRASLPVLATHNADDYLVPASYTINYVDWVNAENPQTRAHYEALPGTAHEGWTESYNPDTKITQGRNLYEWLLQYTSGTEVPLPVTLTRYTASQTAHAEITIAWETGTEIATGFFTLERSATQTGFSQMAVIDATQNNVYSYIDKNALPSDNYYRLSQTEPNGTITYFPVLRATLSAAARPVLSLFPNPVTSSVSIQLRHAEQGSISLALFTSTGALVQQWTVEKTTPEWLQTISLATLKTGSYILQAQGKQFRQTVSFIKK